MFFNTQLGTADTCLRALPSNIPEGLAGAMKITPEFILAADAD